MPFLTTVATALGTGLSAAAGTAASIGSAIATTAEGVGATAALAGAGTNLYGNIVQAQASREAEAIRMQQMRITADRERRQTIRNAMQARSNAVSAGVAQGAFEGSGLAGGVAQVTSDSAQRVGDSNVNENLGAQLFSANAALSQGRSISGIGGGLGTFGGVLASKANALGRIGAQAFGPADPWNTRVFDQYGNRV